MKLLRPLALRLMVAVTPRFEAQRLRLLLGLDELQRRVVQDSNDTPTRYDLAPGLRLTKRYAETGLELSAEASPRDRRPWFWLGLAEMEQGKKPEARDSFTRFLAPAPSRYDRQIGMAKARLAQLQ